MHRIKWQLSYWNPSCIILSIHHGVERERGGGEANYGIQNRGDNPENNVLLTWTYNFFLKSNRVKTLESE